jgi:hypothetical protein
MLCPNSSLVLTSKQYYSKLYYNCFYFTRYKDITLKFAYFTKYIKTK